MGLHIGNSYRPATFDWMEKDAKIRRAEVRRDLTRGARIRRLRLALKFTQTEMADKLGVDQSTVSDMENGAGFSADLLMKMADALEVSPEVLMRGVDQRTWPFQFIPIEEFIALTTEARSMVEGRLMEYLSQAASPTPLKSSRITKKVSKPVTKVQRRPAA